MSFSDKKKVDNSCFTGFSNSSVFYCVNVSVNLSSGNLLDYLIYIIKYTQKYYAGCDHEVLGK